MTLKEQFVLCLPFLQVRCTCRAPLLDPNHQNLQHEISCPNTDDYRAKRILKQNLSNDLPVERSKIKHKFRQIRLIFCKREEVGMVAGYIALSSLMVRRRMDGI